MQKIIFIYRQSPDSLNSIPYVVAAARDRNAAVQWIQDEVDGKHKESHHTYMQGKDAEYWLTEYPVFKLIAGVLQEETTA